jgi:hypothetical protein
VLLDAPRLPRPHLSLALNIAPLPPPPTRTHHDANTARLPRLWVR